MFAKPPSMGPFLADVVADSDFVRNNTGVFLFMALCILSEAAVMWLMKAAPTFLKSLLFSALVNIATLLCGFVLVPLVEKLLPGKPEIYLIGIYFLLSVVIEALLLKPIIKNIGWKKVATTSIVMNLASYTLLILMLVVRH